MYFVVVILAEDDLMKERLAYHDLKVQTVAEVAPLQVFPARVLSTIFSHLGKCNFDYLLHIYICFGA
jgi:phosphorylase kinase alpha/beta subunit